MKYGTMGGGGVWFGLGCREILSKGQFKVKCKWQEKASGKSVPDRGRGG